MDFHDLDQKSTCSKMNICWMFYSFGHVQFIVKMSSASQTVWDIIWKQFSCWSQWHNSGLHISFTYCQQGQNPDMVYQEPGYTEVYCDSHLVSRGRTQIWYTEVYCDMVKCAVKFIVIYWSVLRYTVIYWSKWIPSGEPKGGLDELGMVFLPLDTVHSVGSS